MTRILADFISLTYGFPAKKLFVAAWTILALVLATASPLSADTFPVTGVVGVETGLQLLAKVKLNPAFPVNVKWGDEAPDQPGQDGLLVIGKGGVAVLGTHRYALAGVYPITITYHRGVLGKKTETVATSATISPPQDFVILSIGDSVASGEGDPVVRFASRFWDDPGSDYDGHPCHRSRFAGPALAAQKVVSTNSITFVHLACSGDRVEDAYQQLREARKILPRIDVLTISAGANDLHGEFGTGFGAVVTRCITSNCSNDQPFADDIHDSIVGNPGREGFPGLASLYGDLDKEIHCINPADGTHEPDCDGPEKIPRLVLITEYHDPTHDKKGNFPKNPVRCADPGITAKEFEFLYNHVVVPLNGQVTGSPWHAVSGIQAAFLKHGLCALKERWVDTIPDSLELQGDKQGTGHPNYEGQLTFENLIYEKMVALNPPMTTASATAGDNSYAFGTWTDQDVVVTLSAKNGIQESGVGTTYYAVDDPNCAPGGVGADYCSQYSAPFTVATSSQHKVTFFSANVHGGFEASQSVQVLVDKSPPLASTPKQQIIHRGEKAVYTVTVGHVGWANPTVNVSCKTDAPLATCTMMPASVSLDPADSNTSIATVSTAARGGMVVASGLSARPTPFSKDGAFRILAILATGLFLPAMVLAMGRRRRNRATNFAGLAVLFGVLCTSCGDESRGGTPPGTYDVAITGASGDTSQTYHAVLIVQ